MIDVTILEFSLKSSAPIYFGSSAGSAIRGMLYEGFGRIGSRIGEAQFSPIEENTVRPFGIRPPLQKASCNTVFGVAFYGTVGHELIPLVIEGIRSMQKAGVGRGRERFTLDDICHIDPITHMPTSFVESALLPAPRTMEDYRQLAERLCADRMVVNFVTPAYIIDDGHKMKSPIFNAWGNRLMERISRLNIAYGNGVRLMFEDLKPCIGAVKTVRDNTKWQESMSHSTREGMDKPLSGFVGRVEYRGDLREILPFVLLGQALQVGKNIAKGNGWYKVDYMWK